MDHAQLKELENKALEQLQRRSKLKNLESIGARLETIPSSGKNVALFGAVNANDPAGARLEIALDEEGKEVDLKALGEREAKVFFGGQRRYWALYSYSVKFICGVQGEADGCCCLPAVRPGIYATDINIHNYHSWEWAWVRKSVLPLVYAGLPQGREPQSVTSRAWDGIYLPANTATMDDCCRLNELLFGTAPPAGQPLNVGFLEILSNVDLRVTAVYTVTDRESRAVSIDVEEVPYRIKYPYNYWTPLPTPIPATA